MAAPEMLQPAGSPAVLGPRDRADAWRWLTIALVGLVVGYVMVDVLSTIGAAIAGTKGGVNALAQESEPPVWFVMVGLAGVWCGFGMAAYLVTRTGGRLGLVIARWDSLYIFLGLALQLAIGIVYLPVHLSGGTNAVNRELGGGSGWLLVIPAILTIIGAPVVEELFFRGVLLRALLELCKTGAGRGGRLVGVVVAVVLDGALFGLAHLGSGDLWAQLPALAAVGVVLAALAVKTRRLGPSIVTHAAFNASAVLWYAWSR
jgi:membrane protease YdiL (CAAX protease family)